MASIGLSDRAQAILMFAAFVLPAFSVWLANGAPVDRIALSMLGAAIVSGVLAFLKEELGTSGSSTTTATTTTTAKPATG